VTDTLSPAIRERFERIAAHPFSKSTADGLIAYCGEAGLNLDAGADYLEFQFALAELTDSYHGKCRENGQSFSQVLRHVAVASAASIVRLSGTHPIPDLDAARDIAFTVTSVFADFTMQNFMYLRPPAAPEPTHAAPQSLN
jgi:hypothetical protein